MLVPFLLPSPASLLISSLINQLGVDTIKKDSRCGIPLYIPVIQLKGWKMSTEAATEVINSANGRIMAIQTTAAAVLHQNSCDKKWKFAWCPLVKKFSLVSGFIKGQAAGKLTICEHDFAGLLLNLNQLFNKKSIVIVVN